jgi:hypothetical protein
MAMTVISFGCAIILFAWLLLLCKAFNEHLVKQKLCVHLSDISARVQVKIVKHACESNVSYNKPL